MLDVSTNTFRFRVAGVVLTLAMLLSPSVAQVDAAEYCRKSCAAVKAAGEANCCGQASHAAVPVDPGQSDTGASDAPKGYCPGCGGRPLFVTAPRQMPSLDPAPIFLPALQFLTSAS